MALAQLLNRQLCFSDIEGNLCPTIYLSVYTLIIRFVHSEQSESDTTGNVFLVLNIYIIRWQL